jgi:putative oxidoreductase
VVTTIGRQLKALAPLPLRLMLGFGFLIHGYPKLFTAEGNAAFAAMLAGIEVPVPALSAYLIGAFEFFGGILLILGFAVRIVSALGVAEMLVAAVMVHASAGFDFMNVTGVTEGGGPVYGLPGYEVPLLYLAGFASLMLSGAGLPALPSLGTSTSDEPEREPASAREPEGELEEERATAGRASTPNQS